MFHFAGFHPLMDAWIPPGRLPHSDIHGSKAACAYPQLFAACHVLRRLLVPRHSPYALYTLFYLLSLDYFPLFLCQGAKAKQARRKFLPILRLLI